MISAFIFPLLLCSGVIWPLEGIRTELRDFLYWTPLTQPIDSLRSIMLRGWGLSHTSVQMGFIVSITYTISVTIINIFLIEIYYRSLFC